MNVIRGQLEQAAEKARKGSGLAFEVYIDKLSKSIDKVVESTDDPDEKESILRIAREEYDYHTRQEIAQMQQSAIDNGDCTHGLDPDCCPAGCGDRE